MYTIATRVAGVAFVDERVDDRLYCGGIEPRDRDSTKYATIAAIAIAAVNNAINRLASIAPNSAEIEIQVAVAGWMYRPMRNIGDGWQRQSPTIPAPIPIPYLSFSRGTMRSPVKYS